MARLGDVCTINMGQSPDSATYNENGKGLPFFQGNADFGEIYPTTRLWCSEPTKVARKNDILISVRAPIGALNISNCECCIGRGLAALSVNSEICSQKYLWHALSSKVQELSSKGTGSTFKAINKKILSETEIPLPPLDEQRKIAAVLDKVSDLIAKRRQQLDKLDTLVKARFVEMFGDPEQNSLGWPKAPLRNVITNANNGLARRGNDAEGNIVMRLVELQDGYIDYSSPNRIILNDAEKHRYLLRDNDFLFARVNGNPENVGRCAVFCDIGESVYHNDHIIRVHFDEKQINGTFASALFNSAYGKRQMSSQIKTSAGQYTISQDGIGAIITILPPLHLQERFAAFVSQTDRSKLAVIQSLEKLETLKKSLMQHYFE